MIRLYSSEDRSAIQEIHRKNQLPEECIQDFADPLFLHKAIVEQNGKVAMACFLKGTAELFFFVDHDAGTPQELWDWLKEFRDYMMQQAWSLGLDQFSAFVPPEIEKSFGKRLEELGFRRSPWVCWTLPIA